jgi:hypothetical protein
VYEDSNTAVQCVKVNNTSCAAWCPANMDPTRSGSGWECRLRACDERVPVNGTCSMACDTGSSLCYSLEELSACYSTCPTQTTADNQTAGNPRCVLTPCASRTPDSRGVCLISPMDECFTYNGQCVTECPEIAGYGSNIDKV